MKLYPNKIGAEVSRQVLPVYIISGDEPLLVQEAADDLREALKKAGYLQRDLFHAEGNFNWNEVLFSANSMSLFAEQKILEVRLNTSKLGDASSALSSYVSSPTDGTVLVLLMPRLDQAAQRTKWFKALDAVAGVIQVWPVERKDLPGWLEQRCRRAGLRADREAVALLADRVEGNLLAAVQEIQLLALMSPDGRVTADLVVGGVADSARYDVFSMLDAALVGDSQRAIRIAAALRAEDESPVYINAMLLRELRGLEKMVAAASTSSVPAVMKQFRVWKKRENIVGKALSRLKPDDLATLVAGAARLDGMSKGFVQGDPWIQLQDVLLGLSGKRAVG